MSPRESATPVSQPRAAGCAGQASPTSTRGPRRRRVHRGSKFGGTGGTGSRFLIDGQGHVVTNDHVVEITGPPHGPLRRGRRAAGHRTRRRGRVEPDLAVGSRSIRKKKISGETKPRSSCPLADLRPGDAAVAIGDPFGLSVITVTTGIISALNRDITAPSGFPISDVLQTGARSSPGNSAARFSMPPAT